MQEEEYKGLIVASSDWVAAITHTKISNSVYGTVLLSVFLAAVVVFVFCGRPLLTILATLTVVMANVAVMGLMYVWGWHLGAIEGMSITSLVGLSVDFCIHVAEGYMHGKAPDRKGKARYGSGTFSMCCCVLERCIHASGCRIVCAARQRTPSVCQVDLYTCFGCDLQSFVCHPHTSFFCNCLDDASCENDGIFLSMHAALSCVCNVLLCD
jgi:hypothetical protein